MDLIAGLPYQTPESWRRSLNALSSLRPEHVSVYLLEIDEGSRLGREVLSEGSRYGADRIPDDDTMAACYEAACASLAGTGYEHYEISNWALPGLASQHNLKYWRRESYLGFGAGAHSFLSQGASGGDSKKGCRGRRWANVHDPAAYVAAIGRGVLPVEPNPSGEEVTPRQALEEELFLGLRKLAGIDVERIEAQYDVELGSRIRELCDQGLMERAGPIARLAPGRLTVANEVFVALLD